MLHDSKTAVISQLLALDLLSVIDPFSVFYSSGVMKWDSFLYSKVKWCSFSQFMDYIAENCPTA